MIRASLIALDVGKTSGDSLEDLHVERYANRAPEQFATMSFATRVLINASEAISNAKLSAKNAECTPCKERPARDSKW